MFNLACLPVMVSLVVLGLLGITDKMLATWAFLA